MKISYQTLSKKQVEIVKQVIKKNHGSDFSVKVDYSGSIQINPSSKICVNGNKMNGWYLKDARKLFKTLQTIDFLFLNFINEDPFLTDKKFKDNQVVGLQMFHSIYAISL